MPRGKVLMVPQISYLEKTLLTPYFEMYLLKPSEVEFIQISKPYLTSVE